MASTSAICNPASLTILRAGQNQVTAPADYASGSFEIQPLLDSTTDGEMAAMHAVMQPGVISRWHSHPCGQLLFVTGGSGLVQCAGGEAAEVATGDAVWFAAGEKHWHGAGPHSAFSYISIQPVRNGRAVDWLEPVQPDGDDR